MPRAHQQRRLFGVLLVPAQQEEVILEFFSEGHTCAEAAIAAATKTRECCEVHVSRVKRVRPEYLSIGIIME